VPRRKGESSLYIVTQMMNGGARAECYRDECHWWNDYPDALSADDALKKHRTKHRGAAAALQQQQQNPNNQE
jgi:hypothetical protein